LPLRRRLRAGALRLLICVLLMVTRFLFSSKFPVLSICMQVGGVFRKKGSSFLGRVTHVARVRVTPL